MTRIPEKLGHIWIIGNAPEQNSINHLVHENDIVVRFNNPNPTCTLNADVLFVVTGYSNLKQRINPAYLKRNCQVIFTVTPLAGIVGYWKNRGKLHIAKYFYRLLKLVVKGRLYRFRIRYLRFEYNRLKDELNINNPLSSGCIALYYYLQTEPKSKITLHNFTFEGWGGHAWDVEIAYVQKLIQQGRIELIN